MYHIVKNNPEDGTKERLPRLFKTTQEASDWLLEEINAGRQPRNLFLYGFVAVAVDVTERVKTYEDACAELGKDPDDVNDEFSLRSDEVARRKLEVVAAALNEGWKPRWDDLQEDRWYPYFQIVPQKGAEAEIAYAGAVYSASTIRVSPRICFKTMELAEYVGKTFTDLYQQMLL